MPWLCGLLCLVAALLTVGCGRLHFERASSDGGGRDGGDAQVDGNAQMGDGATLDGAADANPDASDAMISQDGTVDGAQPCAGWVFSTPRALDEINTTGSDWDPDLTDDGLVLVWATDGTAMHIATRPDRSSMFSNPRELTETGGDYLPIISGDGLVLYFEESGLLYRAERNSRGDLFGTPTAVTFGQDPYVNFIDGIDVSDDELRMVMGWGPSIGDYDLVMWERASTADPFSNPQAFVALNTAQFEETTPAWYGANTVIYAQWTAADAVTVQVAQGTPGEPSTFNVVDTLNAGGGNLIQEPKLTADGMVLVFSQYGGQDYDLYLADRICQ